MQPKFSTGYLTPQPTKRKDMSNKKRVGSTENLYGGGEINDELFKQFMNDPIKRKLILNMITSEADKIEAYKKTLIEKKHQPSSLKKVLQKVPCESPTALQRRRALEKLEQQRESKSLDNVSNSGSSTSSVSRQSVASIVPSPVMFDEILLGVTAFVEVKSGCRDRSEAVRALLSNMGAVVRDKFTKDVTHVIFKDGSFTTYQKANLMKVHLVSVLWLEACKTSGMKAPEKKYPAIGTDAYDHNVSALCSQMQKDYEEIIHEEFQRSILSGTPLPSAKSLINKRRTLVTPSSQEVAMITKRALQAGTSKENVSPELTSDDDYDVEPIINGELGERDDILEDLLRSKSDPCLPSTETNKQKLSQTNNRQEDMDLTDVHGEAVMFCGENNSHNLSKNIYNTKTPRMGDEDPQTSATESLDLTDIHLYRRKTKLFANSTPTKEDSAAASTSNGKEQSNSNADRASTPRTARIFNHNNPSTSEETNLLLTPTNLHIFSKNIGCKSPDVTNKDKEAPDINRSTSSLQIHKIGEKSTSTNMSSLRISDNSKKNNEPSKESLGKNESLKSTKMSFSPLQPNVVNNILGSLENSQSPTKVGKNCRGSRSSARISSKLSEDSAEAPKSPTSPSTKERQDYQGSGRESRNNSTSNKSSRTSNELVGENRDLIQETPKNKLKNLSYEHVTIRKKPLQATINITEEIQSGNITEDIFSATAELTEDESVEELDTPKETERPDSRRTASSKKVAERNEEIIKDNAMVETLQEVKKKKESEDGKENGSTLTEDDTNSSQNINSRGKRKSMGVNRKNKEINEDAKKSRNRRTIGHFGQRTTEDVDENEEMNRDKSKDAKKSRNRRTIGGFKIGEAEGLNQDRSNLTEDNELEVSGEGERLKLVDGSRSDEGVEGKKKTTELRDKRHITTRSKRKLEYDEERQAAVEESNHNNSSTRLRTRQSTSTARTNGDISPKKKSQMSPHEERMQTRNSRNIRNTRRQTISSAPKDKSSSKKQVRRTVSSANISVNESDTSSPGKSPKKFRKLYSPSNLRELDVSDEKEREEKRRAKKRSHSGVFVRPIIFSQRMQELISNNRLNFDDIINPSQAESINPSGESEVGSEINKNKKKKNEDAKPRKSVEDEQVELKNYVLNKKGDTDLRQKADTSKSSFFQTPRREVHEKTDKTTPGSSKKKVESSQRATKIAPRRRSMRVLKVSKRPKTPPKQDKLKSTQSVRRTPVTPVQNRRSTLEFQSLTQSGRRKKLKIDKTKRPSIVCTKMHKDEVVVFAQIVKKLGGFEVEDEVSEKTTHLVAGEPKRTINMLRALCTGCWILKREWIFSSLEMGKWLPEEDFEETEFSPAVQKNRLQRQAFGPSFTMDIFQDCGPIYVAKGSTPRCSDLRDLIILCKGKITTLPRSASIVVGEYVKYDKVVCVSETWILDCISQNKKMSFKKYLLQRYVV